MKALRFGLVLLSATLACPRLCPAFDFTLNTVRVEEDGFTRDQSYFTRDAQMKIGIRIPPQWTALGNANALVLTSNTFTECAVRLEPSGLTPATPFDEKGLEIYRKLILADAPAGATGVRFVEEKTNPLPIFHWIDHEFTLEYSLFGRLFTRGVIFINLDATQQMRLTAVGPKTTFGQVHDAGYQLLQSWQETPVTTH